METADQGSKDLKRSVVKWLCEKGHHIAVADYQRSYAWSESHVTAFVETLLDALADEEKGAGTRAPDIGVVVIEKTKSDETSSDTPSSDTSKEARFHVVDGQQRLLTFSLLVVALCGETVCGTENGDRNRSSRLRQLLHPQNLESVIHARQVARKIRNLLSRRPEFRALEKLDREGKLAWLAPVTFSVVEFERKAGDGSNAAVANFFEPLNTTAKPLNGGQILKAHHMGRIYGNNPAATWDRQSRYETWFRSHKEDERLGLSTFSPFCFNRNEEISVERFIDSHDQDAYYRLGCGFVQGVQAMLLGQDKWWWEITSQGSERQAPFERLEGSPRGTSNEGSGAGTDRRWRATEPLAFSEAEGFFRMVGRFARLYDAYCLELSCLSERFGEVIQEKIADHGLSEDDPDRRPARLVCRAARLMAAFGRCLVKWSKEDKRLQMEASLGRLCRWENNERIEIVPWVSDAGAWLALPDIPNDLSNTYGSIPTVVYAAALLWSDKFPQKEADDDIVRLLMVQLLFARFCSRWDSVWRSLCMWEAVAAAHFSTNAQGALWRFLKTARNMGTRWPRELEATINRMPGGREANKPQNKHASDEGLPPEEMKALDELRSLLSQYLSF